LTTSSRVQPVRSRLRAALIAVLGLALGLTLVGTSGAVAGPGEGTESVQSDTGPFVDIIEVSGELDPIMSGFIRESIRKATADKAQALVIQLDSPGDLLSEDDLDVLTLAVTHSALPIAVWVGGPPNPRALGGAFRLVLAADVSGASERARLGEASITALWKDDPLSGATVTGKEALKRKVVADDSPVLVEFVGRLDGKTINGITLDTAEDVVDGQAQLRAVRFQKLDLLERLLHTAVNPTVMYLLLAIGLGLLVFEFFTGGIGVAAGVGIGCLALASYGLGLLPLRPLSLAAIVGAMVAFSIDVQAGAAKFWSAVGTVAFAVGSLTLLTEGRRVPLLWVALVTVLIVLSMVAGMPTMVRTRFATPTIGREAMIGELGEATTAISPEGVVSILGAPWRARTNRATPIKAGEAVRVASIDGLLLEVEPLEGAATDHRG
jgi:membrane-bound serine protease (ClpP class)